MKRATAFLLSAVMMTALIPPPTIEVYAATSQTTEASARTTLRDDLRRGMKTLSPTIKSTFYVTDNNDSYIEKLLNEAVEELFCEKELFNVCDDLSFDGTITKQGKLYRVEANLYVKYVSSKDSLAADRKSFDAAVSSVLSGMDRNWTDIQKAAYLHDKLVEDAEYIKTGNRYTSTPYSALVKHKALCTGYARAYAILMREAGIDCRLISNDSHMWNLAKIDGSWYHVDTTFDDSFINSEQMERVTMHKYFLKSSDYMRAFYDVPANEADSKRFDGMNWDSNSSFAFYGKSIVYVGEGGVYRYDTDKNSAVKLFSVTDRWEIKQGSDTFYWTGYMPQLVQYGGCIYYNLDHSINRYDPAAGKVVQVYKNKKSENMLVGLTEKNGVLYGWFDDDVNKEGTKKALLDLKK